MKEPVVATPKSAAQRAADKPFFSNQVEAPKPSFFQPTIQAQPLPESAEATVAPTTTPAVNSVEEADHDPTAPIRLEVFKLFELLNKKGVLSKPGPNPSEDADWKEITGYTQQDWNDRKALEKPWTLWREYKDRVESRKVYLKAEEFAKARNKKNPIPFVPEPELVEKPTGDPISKLTTCILVQNKILDRASRNLKLKHDTASLMDPKQMEQSPAWNWAQPHMAERPQQGDIFILISLGEKLKKAKTALSRAENQSPKDLQRLTDARDKAAESLKSWQEKSTAELEKIDLLKLEIQVSETNQLQNKMKLGQMKEYAKQLNGPIKIWQKYAADAQKALDNALTAKERAQAMLAEARTGEQFRTQLFFSHVGFFVSKEPMPNDPTKELWKTFDGGQTFEAGNVAKQGAKYVDRVYDPTTNEIWAKPHQPGQIESQDGQTRWFLGWYNLEKLVKPKEENPTKK